MQRAGIRLRPLTVSDLLDETFRIYRANFPLFAGLAIAVAIPTIFFEVIAGTGTVFATLLSSFSNPAALSAPVQQSPIGLLQYPVTLILLPFQTGTLVLAAVLVCLGQPVSFLGVLRAVLRRYFGIWLVNLLLVVASLLFICLPVGIFLLVRLAVALPVFFAERTSATAGIERSWRLTAGSFWRTFGILLLVLVVNYAVSVALAPLLYAAATLLPGISYQLKGDLVVVVSGLLGQVILPVYAIGVTLIYFDLRVRKEAYDLEVQAYRLGAAAAESS